ncbi:uncharacterized protein LOC100830047 isoform X2 [Brachypodium distachyon]|uniref:F-box domain-containing protein n=1 Tax=Brachypodium distachyon TaxID=15368 RepID=A0A2K2CQ32_BRADI|nr:uncharacterized protein LOC100830047 isoform X2 [Brachypodium distachyon]PNT64131.1 hypothetical protein BRADI_4g24807v3 [Brachypodium distachyon]|eukprot:XP_024318475.1 uncharacterized protein LOC100830047 isoform X2 [Brachypodium distachyon]
MAPPPPPLVDDIVEEILLRLPPEDPASLARASLVCKPWRRLLSGAAFRRRYREHHGAPPLLGHLRLCRTRKPCFSSFVSGLGRAFPDWLVLDCRHGRALLSAAAAAPSTPGGAPVDLAVWDPITDKLRRLPPIPASPEGGVVKSFNGAVLCGAQGCDHGGGGDCHEGPFRVVFVFSPFRLAVSFTCVYSSESGEWGELASLRRGDAHVDVGSKPSVLVGDALYFSSLDKCILEYRLSTSRLSVILAPEGASILWARVAIIKGEDGVLGFAEVEGSSFVLWSRQVDADGVAGWARSRAIELETLFPVSADDAPGKFRWILVSGFVEGTDVIFVHAFGDTDTYKVQLKSRRVTKLAESYRGIVIPYAGFYIPEFGACWCGCLSVEL